MPTVFFATLGCPKNTVASKRLQKALGELGIDIVDQFDQAEAIIVNTCGFIDAAKEESIESLLSFGLSKLPGQKVIAIGCLANRYQEELAKALPEVDAVLEDANIDGLPALLRIDGPLRVRDQLIDGKVSAYLEISQGCDNRCSYCAIPIIKGPFVSHEEENLLGEAEKLVASGCRELVLIGQDTGNFGLNAKPPSSLASLLLKLNEIERLKWIRVMYLQPHQLTEELLEAFVIAPKVLPYFDLPIQHADPDILRAMNRRGDPEDYLEKLAKFRANLPELTVRTTVIVGFPGENNTRFWRLVDYVKRARFDYVGIFEFSPEEGTAAFAYRPRVPAKIKTERAAQLRDLADSISEEKRAGLIGKSMEILVEGRGPDGLIGRSAKQAPEIDGDVIVKTEELPERAFIDVKITSLDGYDLVGEPI